MCCFADCSGEIDPDPFLGPCAEISPVGCLSIGISVQSITSMTPPRRRGLVRPWRGIVGGTVSCRGCVKVLGFIGKYCLSLIVGCLIIIKICREQLMICCLIIFF